MTVPAASNRHLTTRIWRSLRRNPSLFFMPVLLAAALAITVAIHPQFSDFDLQSLAMGALPLAFAAAAQTVVVIAGGIDLSIGSVMAVANALAASIMERASFGQSLLLAVAVRWMWLKRARWRWALSAAMFLFVGLQAVRTPTIDWRKRRQLDYDPAVQYLRGQFKPSTFIMGGGGLIYDLGAQWNILDDVRLGYDSGKRAEVVVIDPSWDEGIQMMEGYSPKVYAFVGHLLATEYREVYNRGGYRPSTR